MTLASPFFLVNFKTRKGTAGADGLELARIVESVHRETGATLAVAPQALDVRLLAEHTSVPIVAQAVDATRPDGSNGDVSVEAVAAAGADGALVNHPECPTTLEGIERAVQACANFGLTSIVCVNSLDTGEAALSFAPDWLLFERPADIGSTAPMVRTHPELVETFVELVERRRPETNVFVGGGIQGARDVERGFDLGASAAGASSAFFDADDRRQWLTAVAAVLAKAKR